MRFWLLASRVLLCPSMLLASRRECGSRLQLRKPSSTASSRAHTSPHEPTRAHASPHEPTRAHRSPHEPTTTTSQRLKLCLCSAERRNLRKSRAPRKRSVIDKEMIRHGTAPVIRLTIRPSLLILSACVKEEATRECSR